MTLELNLTGADRADEGFKEYFGSNILQRPLIIAAKRIPMRVAYLMGMRILHPESDCMMNYFDGDDRIAYHPDGERFKIGSLGTLEDYARYGALVNGAIEFGEQEYLALPWKELERSEMILGMSLFNSGAKIHPVWFELAQRNTDLLENFVNGIYSRGNYQSAMGVYLDDERRMQPWMRASFVNGLWGRSQFDGGFSFDDDDRRLVGIAPEALVRLEKRLRDEKRIRVDFVGALGDTRVIQKERIVKSRYDISLAEGEQQYFGEAEVDEAFAFAQRSGQTDPTKLMEIARRRLLSRRANHGN